MCNSKRPFVAKTSFSVGLCSVDNEVSPILYRRGSLSFLIFSSTRTCARLRSTARAKDRTLLRKPRRRTLDASPSSVSDKKPHLQPPVDFHALHSQISSVCPYPRSKIRSFRHLQSRTCHTLTSRFGIIAPPINLKSVVLHNEEDEDASNGDGSRESG